ncbi:sialic acid-binding Ig-like lectin 10 [Rana temporaria]|uniref:sialic acid-binding Ig-like lectin 10 n=1 Tax=Rana temporaria TaxID=8407 RepID=UPI001AADCB82|nr:sialic acid-binding Ig-like lectin 10 [Rana temporaria]
MKWTTELFYRNRSIHIEMQLPDQDHFLLLLFIISSLLRNTTCQVDLSKYTVLVQREISVQRGLCVYIPCRFTVQLGPTPAAYGTWYKGSSSGDVVSSQNPSMKPPKNPGRIFFTGDATKLDCSMSINDVQPSDGGTYLFRFEDVEGGSFNYENYKITLTVTELTEKPVITPVMALLAGKEVTMTCESPGRCTGSAPLITWNRGVLGTSVPYQTIHPDGNKTYYSNITFTPSKQDHQSSLTCIVNFQSSSASTRNQILLNVEYPPNVSIIFKDNIQNENTPIIVKEGDSESIRCMVESNPKSTIIWTKGDKTLPGRLIEQTLIYNVQNANPNDTGIYRCSATNSHSSITRSVIITVHYAPRNPQIHCLQPKDCPIDGNKTIYIKEGSSLSLQCAAESLPPATLQWTKSNKNQPKVNTNQNQPEISFSKIVPSDNGSYICQASNSLGNSSATVTIKVTFGPRSVLGKNSTCKEAVHHIECYCIIESFPEANIHWKIDEKSYNTSDKHIHISTSRIEAETNSTLSLSFNQKDVPSIECISFNQYEKFELRLLSKKSLPETSSLGMIAAVSVVIAVSVILGIAFIILQYSRRRKLKQESKDEKDLTSNSQDAIYSNASVFCNNGEISQEIPNKNMADDDRTVYMNCEEVQYASINFAMMKPKPGTEVTEPETEYAVIKPR